MYFFCGSMLCFRPPAMPLRGVSKQPSSNQPVKWITLCPFAGSPFFLPRAATALYSQWDIHTWHCGLVQFCWCGKATHPESACHPSFFLFVVVVVRAYHSPAIHPLLKFAAHFRLSGDYFAACHLSCTRVLYNSAMQLHLMLLQIKMLLRSFMNNPPTHRNIWTPIYAVSFPLRLGTFVESSKREYYLMFSLQCLNARTRQTMIYHGEGKTKGSEGNMSRSPAIHQYVKWVVDCRGYFQRYYYFITI